MGVEFRGLPQLRRRLHAIQDGRVMLQKLQLDTTAEAKKRVARKTGNTSRTIRPGFLSSHDALVKAGGAGAYLEFGTKPHIIRPKNAKALFFASQKITTERFGSSATLSFTKGGRLSAASTRKYGNAAFVLTTEVHHPGTKPKPFLVPAAKFAVEKGGLAKTVVSLWNEAA